MAQLLLRGFAPVPGSPLEEALLALEARLSGWTGDSTAYDALLRRVFGAEADALSAKLRAEINGPGLAIALEIGDDASLSGLSAVYCSAAYSSAGSQGGERIVLRAGWLASASAEQIAAVLLEELGHAIDQRLNGGVETPGDEGEIFSALLRGASPNAAAFAEDDHRLVRLNGVVVSVEAADTTPPAMEASGPSSGGANGSFSVGKLITILVPFTETVVVDTSGGTPTLQLETGGIDRWAKYSSGSGTATLSFSYIVQAGDSSNDLDQLSSTALRLNGGTIRDVAGNPAILTLAAAAAPGSLAANAALKIDTKAPIGVLGSYATAPAYATSSTNPFGISDVGGYAHPAFADVDGDGDLDLFVGELSGNILVFRNTAAAGNTAPAYGTPSMNPFGIRKVGSQPTPAFADIDGDGDLDLFLGEFSGDTRFFRNTAVAGASAPAYGTAISNPFGISDAGYRSRPAFADADSDGDLDLFVGQIYGNTLFFRNSAAAGDSAPAYALFSTNPFAMVDVGSVAAPTFVDLEGDGDLDVVTGNLDGHIWVQRNSANATAPAYSLPSTNPFGIRDVGAEACPAFADADADGDLDLFIGESNGNIVFFRNTAATPVAPVRSTNANGSYGIGADIILTVQFSEAVFVSTAGGTPTLQLETGSIDRWATYSSGSGSDTLSFRYIVQAGDRSNNLDQLSSRALRLNGGTIRDAAGNNAILILADPGAPGSLAANADLVIDTKAPRGSLGSEATAPAYASPSSNPFGIRDVGEQANPAFADGDGDGDLDLLIGERRGNSLFFKNTAVAGAIAPAYAAPSSNPWGITNVGDAAAPSFADLDGDGDLDLFIGTFYGNTLVFRNTAATGASAAAYASPSTNPFGITDLGYFASPAFVDADGDNDLDLLIGGFDGNLYFFQNTAAAGAGDPSYSSASLNPFGISDVGVSARPAFADVDVDGDLDLFVGTYQGNILFFRNSATAGSGAPAYASPVTNPFGMTDVGSGASPAFADADGDGDLDLFVGTRQGHIQFFRNTAAPPVAPVRSTTASGNYGLGSVITLTLQFSEPVFVNPANGTPTLQLETGSQDRWATYSHGSGTDTLSFQYIVQAGDSSADLDQLSAHALQLNGGTIRDAAGNNAILTLAAPGATGSLAANAQLVIDGVAPTGRFDFSIATDTGETPTISSGGFSRDNTLGLSGQYADDHGVISVEIFDGSTKLGDAALNNGAWTYITPALANGLHSFTARVTDLVGNQTITTPPCTATIIINAITIDRVSLFSTNEGYALFTGSGAPLLVTYPGGNASPNNPGRGWSALAAQSTATGFALFWGNSTLGQSARWDLDSSGAYSSGSLLSPEQLLSDEASLNLDLNGDGYTAGPRTIQGLNLGRTSQGYALGTSAGAPLQVTYPGGMASATNPGSGWSALAATPLAGGYNLYWYNSDRGLAARWNLDSSGAYTSGYWLFAAQLQREEANLQLDLNGDGYISGPRTIQEVNLGSTSQGYALVTGSGAPVQVTYPGGNASPTHPGQGWIATAAAPTDSGFSLYWSNPGSGQAARWQLDSNGVYQSGLLLSASQLIAEELAITADLNGDSIIGSATITLENQGNASLLRHRDGNAAVQVGSELYSVVSPFGLGPGDASSDWQMLAAETVDGQNQILWRYNPGNFLHLWTLDSSWVWQSSDGAINPSSAAALGLETSFQLDLNGDGLLG